jgi:type II secretory pathway predicted ATPase ExeA
MCGGIADGASKDFFHRLFNGKAQSNHPTLKRLRPRLARGLMLHLLSLGLPMEAALTELRAIFSTEELLPMLAQRTTLGPTACKHFGLKRDPFTVGPQAREEVWLSPQHEQVLATMTDAINHQRFIAVVGEIGAGKSTLKRRLIEDASASGGKQRLLWPKAFAMGGVKAGSIARFVLEAFEQKTPLDAIARTARLERLLEGLYRDDVRVALAFDECHRLADETLAALKNFYELGTGGYLNYLGIILLGQPAFTARLREPRHRELAERIEVINMPTLEKTAWSYVTHRIGLVGGNAEQLFERKAVEILAEYAPTPLALGNLCNQSLRLARQYGEEKVTPALLKAKLNLISEPRIREIKQA